ncbi:MAG: SRPBCC domain-containing protein [Flexibacteraceae bacterium]
MEFRTISEVIYFENVSASYLFNLYTDATLHTEVTGAPVNISNKLGDAFSAYSGFCIGENLDIIKDKLIIQTWRTSDWPIGTDDSIVIIRLVPEQNNCHLYLTHENIPEHLAEGLRAGWHQFYWDKWKAKILQLSNQH